MYETKYKIGDDVFILKYNKVERRTINHINISVGCSSPSVTYTFQQCGCGSSGSVYQHEIFATKQELLDSL